MHTNGTNSNEMEDTNVPNDRPKTICRDERGGSGSHAVDRLSRATLTEYVLRFLERYNKSIDCSR
jgi:hypothetical protein